MPQDAAKGVFSVSESKQVYFSQGNLYYLRNAKEWYFHSEQYEVSTVTAFATDNEIDLFGWSANNTTAPYGISTSMTNNDYKGDFVDWGTNTIGTDAPNTWRTLTKDEWYYLRSTRANADNLVGVARIALNADGSKYANGLILLPDNWTCPAGVTFKSGFSDTYSVQAYADYQTITLADWQKLEAAGAVFLPASGYRFGSNVYDVQNYGDYWSATPDDSDRAGGFYFYSDEARTYDGNRYDGQAVRLVRDCQGTGTGIENPSAADAGEVRKVLRNGQVLIERNGKTYTLTGVEVK